jgi:FMN reductase
MLSTCRDTTPWFGLSGKLLCCRLGEHEPGVPMVEVTVVVGNPKPRSRTREIAEMVAACVVERTGARLAETIDLCDVSSSMFCWPNDTLADLSDRLAATDIAVIACPTYKAAYTGLLKAFLDRYSSGGLSGVTAIPVMTGAGLQHTLAVDTSLRPLLVELGASVPTRGLYFETSQMDQMTAVVNDWAAVNLGATGAILASARTETCP